MLTGEVVELLELTARSVDHVRRTGEVVHPRVLGELGEERCRQHLAVGPHQGHGGLVAARLDSQDDRVVGQHALASVSLAPAFL